MALERWTALLAAGAILVAWLATPRLISLGVSLGAGLMVLNAWGLGRIAARVLGSGTRPGMAVLWFNLKFALLVAAVYLILRFVPVSPMGFIVGISVFPVAILLTVFTSSKVMPAPEQPEGGPEGGNE